MYHSISTDFYQKRINNSTLWSSPPVEGCVSNCFYSDTVRSLAERFPIIGAISHDRTKSLARQTPSKIQWNIVHQCAPVLKGIKISNLISMKRCNLALMKEYLSRTGISFYPVYFGREKVMILLYRYRELQMNLRKPASKIFLAEYGYHDYHVKEVLLQLKERYLLYKEEDGEFPHELGIILGYPLADIRGFIHNQGKNYLYSGYWKVYHNPDAAKQTFDLYDEIRKKAVSELIAGFSLDQIVAAN